MRNHWQKFWPAQTNRRVLGHVEGWSQTLGSYLGAQVVQTNTQTQEADQFQTKPLCMMHTRPLSGQTKQTFSLLWLAAISWTLVANSRAEYVPFWLQSGVVPLCRSKPHNVTGNLGSLSHLSWVKYLSAPVRYPKKANNQFLQFKSMLTLSLLWLAAISWALAANSLAEYVPFWLQSGVVPLCRSRPPI